MTTKRAPLLAVHPLTIDRWNDFERLFGPRGACGGCWCMTPRLTRAEYERSKGEANHRAMRKLVESGAEPGLLAQLGREPVAWLALAPRAEYRGLLRSRVMKPVDERPAWAIACVFVAKEHRDRGIASRLIAAALAHARRRDATLVEACPHEPRDDRMLDLFAWTGIASSFLANGALQVTYGPPEPIAGASTRVPLGGPIPRARVRARAHPVRAPGPRNSHGRGTTRPAPEHRAAARAHCAASRCR